MGTIWNSTLPRYAPLRVNPGSPLRRRPLEPGVPWSRTVPLRAAKGKSAAAKGSHASSARGESFPPAVAALLDARDPWCVHCGSPFGLQRHHRRIKGMGGDRRSHTDCACDGVRICRSCHEWAHSGDGQRDAEAEGLIIPRATVQPWTLGVLVRTADGGLTKYPSCDGGWLDEVPGRDAA
jgi:hypothetical protein